VTLPKSILKVVAPPLKCQGIKTKLVPFLAATIEWEGLGRWIEPFSGSSVVALNIAPDKASLFDANPHIIDIYQGIQQGRFNPKSVREFLELEGEQLRKSDGAHYYDVRARFNEHKDPLDYLSLSVKNLTVFDPPTSLRSSIKSRGYSAKSLDGIGNGNTGTGAKL
jgi:DNA adenine methylase